MSTQQNGLVAGNSQNQAGGVTGKSRSTFPLSYSFFNTERFAEYTPFYIQEGVDTDSLPLHSNHEVQTYTLKSPILQSLAKKKDYFMVPMQSILPLNWEKFYTNPNIGEDVPLDCGTGVEEFWSKMKTLFTNSLTYLKSYLVATGDDAPADYQRLDVALRFLVFFEKIYSCGSLMESLGISGHNWFRAYRTDDDGNVFRISYDEIFDICLSWFADAIGNGAVFVFSDGSTAYKVASDVSNDADSYVYVTLREMLEMMRDDPSIYFLGSMDNQVDGAIVNQFIDHFNNGLTTVFSFDLPASDAPLNLARLWAYQLVCAHYYSNDHVDYIYSAELFRQYIWELTSRYTSASFESVFYFSVNGMRYEYDALSAFLFNKVYSGFTSAAGIFGYSTASTSINDLTKALAYFTALFSFKRSLRFMDYFTGARTRPVAVGNTTVDVNASKVDIIDLSRSSMMTKFLMAVNRSGRKFGAYMQELFGKTPAYDYHNPMYLAHTSDLVGAQETENTGAAQVDPDRAIAVTSRLRATSSRYAFEFNPDRDAVIIGITYYDLPRVYLRATERQAFMLDRFDYFNPYLQFTGDQPIWQAEIGTDTPTYGNSASDVPFAYQNRDMQWKQRFNQAAGGFCVPSTGLDNWIFPADTLRRKLLHNISPSFIRSFNSEIDRFYQSLTGYSLGTYFHFIVRYDSRMDASRPMAFAPTLNV